MNFEEVFKKEVDADDVDLYVIPSEYKDLEKFARRIWDAARKDLKPSWDDAPEWANYLAQDYDGKWGWYKSKPETNNGLFGVVWLPPEIHGRYQPIYFENWKETLEERSR